MNRGLRTYKRPIENNTRAQRNILIFHWFPLLISVPVDSNNCSGNHCLSTLFICVVNVLVRCVDGERPGHSTCVFLAGKVVVYMNVSSKKHGDFTWQRLCIFDSWRKLRAKSNGFISPSSWLKSRPGGHCEDWPPISLSPRRNFHTNG